MHPRSNTIETFWSRIDRAGPTQPHMTTPCWEWTGTIDGDGYGRMKLGTKLRGAHQLSWEQHGGEDRNGRGVLHKCDWRRCVNPDHLFLGSTQENTADRHAKGRSASGDRNGGRTRPDRLRKGVENGMATLTPESVREIRRQRAAGVPRRDVAGTFNVTKGAIWAVEHRRTWAWLSDGA